MRIFLSNFTNRIDAKGRVSVPAPFRRIIEQEDEPGVFVMPSPKGLPCLEGMGHDEFQRFVDMIEAMPPYEDGSIAMQWEYISEAHPLPFDDTGRILLPAGLRTTLGLAGDQIKFAGVGRKFQMWDPAQHAAQRDARRHLAEEKTAALPGRGQALS